MASSRDRDDVRVCLVLPRVIIDKIDFYAARQNLDWELAMHDLLASGLHGEDVPLDVRTKRTPAAGE